MNRIRERFQELLQRRETAFIPFITGGDPGLAISEDIVVALEEAGADIIEYGAPFSDPVGDGAVIQEASLRALGQGVSLRRIVESIARIRKRSQVPVLIFTYFNPVLAYGIEAFARDAKGAGADGVLCVDLPPEEADTYRASLHGMGLTTVFLAAPTSTEQRLSLIGSCCDTFIYYISRLGVTGAQQSLASNLRESVERVRRASGKPVAVGFGISTPEQATEVAGIAEGVVVGSAIVRHIADCAGAPETAARAGHYAAALAKAVKGRT